MVKSFSSIFCISVVDHKRNNYDSCSSFIFFMFPTLCYNTTKTAYQTVPGPDTQRIIVAIKIIENKQGIMQVSNVLSMEIIIRKYYMQTVITLMEKIKQDNSDICKPKSIRDSHKKLFLSRITVQVNLRCVCIKICFNIFVPFSSFLNSFKLPVLSLKASFPTQYSFRFIDFNSFPNNFQIHTYVPQ